MKNKYAIESLLDKAITVTDFVHKDIDSNKPHVTTEYVKQQLGQVLAALESVQQYLNLED